jgi:hypothetical protein
MRIIDVNKSICKANDKAIFILKFGFTNPIEVSRFCDLAQEILYDEQGSSGYFRMAPKEQNHLNEDFIEFAGKKADYKDFYDREDNEIIAAFLIRETDPDVPLNEELTIFPEELAVFCERTNSTVEQIEITTMY